MLAVTAPCVNEIIRSNVENWIRLAERGDHRELMIDTAEKSYSEEYLEKFRKIYPVIGKIGKPPSYDRFLINARAILRFNAIGELGRIDCPVLIIGGEKDKIVGPQATRELHENIIGSELNIYPDFGHGAYEEAKDFYERVFRFLETR